MQRVKNAEGQGNSYRALYSNFCFTVSLLAADWHELMIPQSIVLSCEPLLLSPANSN